MSNSHIAALVLAWLVGFGLTDLIGLAWTCLRATG
jgi:hypothetical protein